MKWIIQMESINLRTRLWQQFLSRLKAFAAHVADIYNVRNIYVDIWMDNIYDK